MKLFIFGILVALATAAPAPLDEPTNDAVEVVVNGLADDEALDVGDIVDVKLQHTVEGELVAVHNVLHPFTAEGIAEIAAAELAQEDVEQPAIEGPVAGGPAVEEPSIQVPIVEGPEIEGPSIQVPVVEGPEIDGPSIQVPVIEGPEIEEPSVQVPIVEGPIVEVPVVEPVVPVAPEVAPEVVPENIEDSAPIPAPAPQIPSGEVYNDGLVQVSIHVSEDAGYLATVQSWISMAINYISNGIQTTQQII